MAHIAGFLNISAQRRRFAELMDGRLPLPCFFHFKAPALARNAAFVCGGTRVVGFLCAGAVKAEPAVLVIDARLTCKKNSNWPRLNTVIHYARLRRCTVA